MTSTHTVVSVLLTSLALQAQTPDSIAARRGAVESSLLPPVVTKGDQGYGIRERMAEHRVPGVSVAVINDGQVEWAAGYGVKRLGSVDSVRVSTLFQAASISKSLTGAAVLRQVDDGMLELARDVAGYLRSWTLPEGAQTGERRVTLRTLLSHTAGINVHGFGGVPRGSQLATTVEVLEGGAGTQPIRVTSTPGEVFRYSGGGYQIVQLILEDATGEPFAQLVQRTVLEPLNLERSTFEQPLPERFESDAATGHQRSPSRLLDTIPGGWHEHPAVAAAGLWTTPRDLARFVLDIRAASLGEPAAILERESARAVLTPVNGGFGLGVNVRGAGASLRFEHGGNGPGYAAFYVLYPATGDGLVVMANATASGALVNEVVRAVERVYGWPGDYAPKVSFPIKRWLLRSLLLVLVLVLVWQLYLRRSDMTRRT